MAKRTTRDDHAARIAQDAYTALAGLRVTLETGALAYDAPPLQEVADLLAEAQTFIREEFGL